MPDILRGASGGYLDGGSVCGPEAGSSIRAGAERGSIGLSGRRASQLALPGLAPDAADRRRQRPLLQVSTTPPSMPAARRQPADRPGSATMLRLPTSARRLHAQGRRCCVTSRRGGDISAADRGRVARRSAALRAGRGARGSNAERPPQCSRARWRPGGCSATCWHRRHSTWELPLDAVRVFELVTLAEVDVRS